MAVIQDMYRAGKKHTATPPAPQNINRRRQFFLDNPDHPRAKAALKRIAMETSRFEPWWARLMHRRVVLTKKVKRPEIKATPIEKKPGKKSLVERAQKFMKQKTGASS